MYFPVSATRFASYRTIWTRRTSTPTTPPSTRAEPAERRPARHIRPAAHTAAGRFDLSGVTRRGGGMHKKAAIPACRPALRAGRQGSPEAAGVSANAAEKKAAYSPAMPQRGLRSLGRMQVSAKRFSALSGKYAPAAFCRGRVFAHTAEEQAGEFRGLQNALFTRTAVPDESLTSPAFFWGSAFIPPQSQTRALRSVKPFYRIFGKRRH